MAPKTLHERPKAFQKHQPQTTCFTTTTYIDNAQAITLQTRMHTAFEPCSHPSAIQMPQQ
jgi:hypothetical protein